MDLVNGITGSYSSFAGGSGAISQANLSKDKNEFDSLINSMMNKSTLSSSEVAESGRLNGDYTTGFSGTYSTEVDKSSAPIGAAANSATSSSSTKSIDRTSKLYEQSLELESYLVKMMLSSMKSTLSTSGLNGEKSYAQSTYEDMMYDELAVQMTKSAGFGLADQIYLELA